jgi:Domain of unknown function (DUF4326)
MAERVRLRRAKGWRKPPNTVVVSRPSRFGNPFGCWCPADGPCHADVLLEIANG